MKLYLSYLKVQLKTAMGYKGDTFLMTIASALSSFAPIFSVYLLFGKYTSVGGYGFNEVLIMFSVVLIVFSVSEMMFRGFDQFDKLVRNGELDRLLIRPRSIFFQVLGIKIELSKIGRIILGSVLLWYALATSTISWTFMKIITLCLMLVSGIIIYLGIYLLSSSFTIFTVEGAEVVNIFTNGSREVCTYPLDIYHKIFKLFFTFIVPLACFNYIPLKYLLDNVGNTSLFYALFPLVSIIFFIPCVLVFNWSLKHYKSTGS